MGVVFVAIIEFSKYLKEMDIKKIGHINVSFVLTEFSTIESFYEFYNICKTSNFIRNVKNSIDLKLIKHNNDSYQMNIKKTNEDEVYEFYLKQIQYENQKFFLIYSFDMSSFVFNELIKNKLIRHTPGLSSMWIDPDTMVKVINQFAEEDERIKVRTTSDPFALRKVVQFPAQFEKKFKDDAKFKKIFIRRIVDVQINAPKWLMEDYLKMSREDFQSDLVYIDFKIKSPNPGRIKLNLDKDATYREIKGEFSGLDQIFNFSLQKLFDKLKDFDDFLPKIIENNGNPSIIKKILPPKKKLFIEFSKKVQQDFSMIDSLYLEKIFTEGQVLARKVEFYGYTIERNNLNFRAKIFDSKFQGEYYIELITDRTLRLFIYPSVNTTKISILNLIRALQEGYDWDLEIKGENN